MTLKIQLDLTFLLYHSSKIFYFRIIILLEFTLARKTLSLMISETKMTPKFLTLP